MISSSDHVVVIPKGGAIRTSLISKESSAGNPSFRVYYGVAAGAVPFLWESQPGTPKHVLAAGHAATIPPLTPPPSYFASPTRGRPSSAKSSSAGAGSKKYRLSPGRLIHAILPKLRQKPPARMSRSSSGSSSCSSPARRHGRRPSCPPSSYFSNTGCSEEEEEEEEDTSPMSTLCFGARHGRGGGGGGGGGCSAWVALGGHGSGS